MLRLAVPRSAGALFWEVAVLEPTTIILIVAFVALLPLACSRTVDRATVDDRIHDVAQHSRRLLDEAEPERGGAPQGRRDRGQGSRVPRPDRARAGERQKEMQAVERRLGQKEEQVTAARRVHRRDGDYHSREEGLRARADRPRRSRAKQHALALRAARTPFERIAGLTAEEAKQRLLAQMERHAVVRPP